MQEKKNITVMYIIMLVMFMAVILRLYSVMSSSRASEVLSGQYTRRLDIAEKRGEIYDRNGNSLNMESIGYTALVNPHICGDKKKTAEKLSAISDYQLSVLYEKMLRNIPFTLKTENNPAIDGVTFYPTYRNATLCAPHTVGYTDKSGKGITGTEKYFDTLLSWAFSKKASYRYMSDALGRVMDGTGGAVYDNGYGEKSGVYLTLDKNLQLRCEELVKNLEGSGAICVTDTVNGEILAFVSYPSFSTDNVAEYLESPKGELVNRCTSMFTPGSVFKTVSAAAALEKDINLYNLEYECTGSITTPDGEVIPCHKKDGHGIIDMKTAYAQSCNPYFINLAFIIGDGAILDAAGKMGFIKSGTLDGAFPYRNIIPEYSESLSSEYGYIANLAIGQGKTLISPVSACAVYSSAVTGVYSEPGILLKISDGDGSIIRDYGKLRKKQTVLSEETVKCLILMMQYCVTDGLGRDADPQSGFAGGKTATAQTGSRDGEKEVLNCWFCGIYPADSPEYTVCVLYRNTKNGKEAKNLFRNICEYLQDNHIAH